MAVDINHLKEMSAEYGLDVELLALQAPDLSGRVAALSGPEMPSKKVLDELIRRFYEACPALVRVVFDITPK